MNLGKIFSTPYVKAFCFFSVFFFYDFNGEARFVLAARIAK